MRINHLPESSTISQFKPPTFISQDRSKRPLPTTSTASRRQEQFKDWSGSNKGNQISVSSNVVIKLTLSMLQKGVNAALWPSLIHMSPDCNSHWINNYYRNTVCLLRDRSPFCNNTQTQYSQRSPVLVFSAAKTLFSVATSTFLDDCTCVSKWEKRTLPTYCCLLWITSKRRSCQKVNNFVYTSGKFKCLYQYRNGLKRQWCVTQPKYKGRKYWWTDYWCWPKSIESFQSHLQ